MCVMADGSLSGGVLMTMHRLSQGGADRVAVLLANGFVAAGIPTGIALLRGGGEGEECLLDLMDRRVVLSYAGSPMGSRHLELVRGLSHIQRQIASERPAVVLASSNNMGLVTGLSAKLQRQRGPRYAMKVTNPVVRPRDKGVILEYYRHRLYGFIFDKYERVLTLTDAERGTLSKRYPQYARKFYTTPNAYITAEMIEYRPVNRISNPPTILTLARMMPQKRLDLLLLAFSKVSVKEARLVILGDGPERRRLERLAKSLGVSERVEMPGFIADVAPRIRNADLFALSSDYEGLPAALLEALACNVPVVTTDCFDGAHGLLAGAQRCAVVPRGDTAAFARAIDASLAERSAPLDLRDIARSYGIEAAVTAHISALEPLLNSARGHCQSK
jgi:glycosyltransferase involved in cell wall biosynthesis